MKPQVRKLQLRTGTATVEFALVATALAFFIVGAIDLGRLGKVCDGVTAGARNGAQLASSYGDGATSSGVDLGTNFPSNVPTTKIAASIRAAVLTEFAGLADVTASNPTITTTIIDSGSTNTPRYYAEVKVEYNLANTTFFSRYTVSKITRTVRMPMMPS